MWSGKQVHLGLWFLTLHSALIPHCSNGHGSWHSLSIHAWVNGHSESLLQPAKEKTCRYNNVLLILSSYFYHENYVGSSLTFFADSVRVSNKSVDADTDCSMIFGFTLSIHTTSAGVTRVLAFFLYACKMKGAFRVRRAFGFRCWKNDHAYIIVFMQFWHILNE